jgi:hypothetical protein
MNNFIAFTRPDGTIEYRHPNYDELIAREQVADTPIEITAEDIAASHLRCLRKERDKKLAETDWWANSDLTMTQAQIDYRQALRDITNSYSSYLDVVWPEKP